MPTFADRFALPFPASTFGNRFGVHDVVDGRDLYGADGHRGTDFVVAAGTGVPAVATGQVVHVLHSVALGNVVVIRHYLHGDGNDVYSGSCHLTGSSVRAGQNVTIGQIIGQSGATGTAATGPHLHLTMSHDDMGVISGEVFDPIAFIRDHSTVTAKPVTATARYATARRNEGLIAIAARSGITFDTIKALNPKITGPHYVVLLDQKVRIS